LIQILVPSIGRNDADTIVQPVVLNMLRGGAVSKLAKAWGMLENLAILNNHFGTELVPKDGSVLFCIERAEAHIDDASTIELQ
jgi:hypothetical protein